MEQVKLGKFIAQLRSESNLTQEQLAEKLNVGSKTISKWECGTSTPDFETMIKISQILNVTLYELSICQRIKKKHLKKDDILKFISKNNMRNLGIKKIIVISLSIIASIILLLSLTYTVTHYSKTKIYFMESLDKDYEITGTLVKTNGHNMMSLVKVAYVGNDDNFIESEAYHYGYEVLYDNERIYHSGNLFNKSIKGIGKLEITNVLNNTCFLSQYSLNNVSDKENLILIISYLDNKNKTKTIEIKFHLIINYKSTILF